MGGQAEGMLSPSWCEVGAGLSFSVCGCVPALGMGWADAGLNSWHVACVVKLVDSIRCCFVRPHREGCELLASPRGSGVRWGVTHQVALHVRTCQPVLW